MPPSTSRPHNVAFLLAQIGAEVSERFAERVQVLGLSPSEAACLRILAASGPINQRQVAQRMGIVPSRVVTLVDGLQARSLVERRAGTTDRRSRELVLTTQGRAVFARLRAVATEHEQEFVAGLEPEQVELLGRMLRVIAERRGLAVGAPPGAGEERRRRGA